MRLRFVSTLIDLARRRHDRTGAPSVGVPPPPTGPPLDHQRVLQVGDALQSCYPDTDEMLDDNLTALMLRLTVETDDPSGPGKR